MKKININFFNDNIKEEYKKFFLLFILLNLIFIINIDSEICIKRKKALSEGKKYIQQCFDDILLNNNSKTITLAPKISIIIPVYNCQNTIKAVVRSIQNQNMSDLEILLVNDYSKDNTSKIIQELEEEDHRIKIINNEKRMATLYSRNIGILHSKGKYILNLDNDDLFMNADLFDIIYNEAEINNLDLIGFSAVEGKSYNFSINKIEESIFHDHKDGLTVYQPELTYFAISQNNKYNLNDVHIWWRLTRADLYKDTINNLGKNAIGEIRNSCFVTWDEDDAMSMALYRYAKSYKFIKKYGIFHYLSDITSSITSKDDLKRYGELFFLDIVFDFSFDNFEGKKYSVIMLREMIIKKIHNFYNEKNVEFLKAILKKMLHSQYISFADKEKIMKYFNKIKFIKYQLD